MKKSLDITRFLTQIGSTPVPGFGYRNPRSFLFASFALLLLVSSCSGDRVGGYRSAVVLDRLDDPAFVHQLAEDFRDYGQLGRLGEGAYLVFGRLFRDAGYQSQALRSFEMGWDREQDSIRELVGEDLVQLHIDQGSWALAERSALRARRAFPENTYFTRQLILARQAQYKDTRVLQDLADLDDGLLAQDPELLLARAVSRHRTGSPGAFDSLVPLFFGFRSTPVHNTAAAWLEDLEDQTWVDAGIPAALVWARAALAAGRYQDAVDQFTQLPDDVLSLDLVMRDFGSAARGASAADIYETRLAALEDPPPAGYTWLGILRRDLDRLTDAAVQFRRAWEAGDEADIVLWYWLDSVSRVDIYGALDIVLDHGSRMQDARNFTDVFDRISAALAGAGDYVTMMDTFGQVQRWMAPATRARWALTLSFAAESGYLPGTTDPIPFREMAYDQTDDWYAHLVAAVGLGEPVLFLEEPPVDESAPASEDQVALAYLRFGRLDDLYILGRSGSSNLSPVVLIQIAEGFADDLDYLRALRVLVVHLRRGVTGEGLLRQAYPRAYEDVISAAAAERDIPPEVLYGLIREESFFAPGVASHAGAVGLSQLMPATAADVASRMGMQSYDVTDPEDNVAIGSWYLADLRRRLGPLQSLFAYNAGWGRVRRWNSLYSHYPSPLYLEAVGIEETRTYGRKVITAATVYGYLYDGIDPAVTLAQFFPELSGDSPE